MSNNIHRTHDVIIIGAGASGLYCAANFDKKTNGLIIDQSRKPGLKLLMSGSGQCNLTHGGNIKEFINHYGDNGSKIRTLLYKHNNLSVRDFFDHNGCPTFERTDAKVFPKSMAADDVLQALLEKANANGFTIKSNEKILTIQPQDKPTNTITANFQVTTTTSTYFCANLIIATGGCSYKVTGSDGSMFEILNMLGIKTSSVKPALVPIFVQNYPYSELSGISFKKIRLTLFQKSESLQACDSASQTSDAISQTMDSTVKQNPNAIKKTQLTFLGDILFTHSNLSGPVILNSSRYINTGDEIAINYFPKDDKNKLNAQLKKFFIRNHKTLIVGIYDFCQKKDTKLPKRFLELLLERLGLEVTAKCSSISGENISSITNLLTCDLFSVSGLGSFTTAMVTKGGIALSEIDLRTMETKKYPHLYIIGEALDIDGDTGGYNLQFAFSSAFAAANHVTSKI